MAIKFDELQATWTAGITYSNARAALAHVSPTSPVGQIYQDALGLSRLDGETVEEALRRSDPSRAHVVVVRGASMLCPFVSDPDAYVNNAGAPSMGNAGQAHVFPSRADAIAWIESTDDRGLVPIPWGA